MQTLPVITARHLSIGYSEGKQGQHVVHRDLSFDLWRGELTCLLGPNGAGKSTLLRTLSAFQAPLEGELLFENRPLESYSEREKSRKIGVVLTDKTQVGGLTVSELVALGRQPHTGFWGRLNDTDRRIIRQAMESVGIDHKKHSYMAELSDGERQKVMIAKALVQECPLILLDEPTAFLDVVSRIEIMTLLHTIAQQQQKTILLSTHDIDQALIQADRLWLLDKGKGLQSGVTEDVVFNGGLDQLFDRDKIRFDQMYGGYTPLVRSYRKVRVKAADPVLWHWAVNMLNRYHYSGLPDDTQDKEVPVLTVNSPYEMSWSGEGSCFPLNSFEGLSKLLKAANEGGAFLLS